MPPFTPAELTYLVAEAKRWQKTGYGVDPNQQAFRHRDDLCGCHQCAGTPISYTVPPVFQHAHRPMRSVLRPWSQS